MPSFSNKSASNLNTCHPKLIDLFNQVIKFYDCTIIQGHRTKEEQDEYFYAQKSQVRWPDSKHNKSPSLAVDVAPWVNGRIPWPRTPVLWTDKVQRNTYIKDLSQFYHFAGYVEGVAEMMGIKIRWGGDWDKDHDLMDNKFDDLVHFELVDD